MATTTTTVQHFSRFCKGTHAVSGGCENESCRGKELCIAGCVTCPDFVAAYDGDVNRHCRGQHSVRGGCENEACRGLELCIGDCVNCPDFVQYRESKNIAADPVDFWSRSGSKVKLYMACLAGPADPNTRNDIALMQKLQARFQVPQDNVWMLLEKQVSARSVHATLADLAEGMEPSDAAFVYIGGHGGADTDAVGYRLGSYYGAASGEKMAPLLWSSPAPLFVVIDSCHSGAMIHDLQAFATAHPELTRCPELTVLTSTRSHLSAATGWRLIAMLLRHLVEAAVPMPPLQVAKAVRSELVTGLAEQKAQFAYFKRGQLVEGTDQRE